MSIPDVEATLDLMEQQQRQAQQQKQHQQDGVRLLVSLADVTACSAAMLATKCTLPASYESRPSHSAPPAPAHHQQQKQQLGFGSEQSINASPATHMEALPPTVLLDAHTGLMQPQQQQTAALHIPESVNITPNVNAGPRHKVLNPGTAEVALRPRQLEWDDSPRRQQADLHIQTFAAAATNSVVQPSCSPTSMIIATLPVEALPSDVSTPPILVLSRISKS